MEKVMIMGIKIGDRVNNSKAVQGILSEYGCSIKTRLGLHEINKEGCARAGLVILELVGDENLWNKLQTELTGVKGVEVQKMEFIL